LLDSNPDADAERYGLALALLANNQAEEAAAALAPLLQAQPMRLPYVLAQADIDMARNRSGDAEQRLRRQLAISPGNHPLLMHYSDLLQQQRRYDEALQLLRAHSQKRPQDPAIWYRLAELHGLAGNIRDLHQAR